MHRPIFRLVVSLLLLTATQAHADKSFMVSPAVGKASISNISGYGDANLLRVDGSYYLLPEFGFNVFVAGYQDFKSSGSGTAVAIKVNGFGPGLIARWPVHPNVQPYARLDYMRWTAEATGLGRTLGKDTGGSMGLALGAQFPISSRLGIRAEVAGYNNVSGANIRQFLVGLTVGF